MANYFTQVKDVLNNEYYLFTNEGRINDTAQTAIKFCMLTSPNGSKQKEDCTIQFFLLRRYNDYRQSKSKDTNPFRNSRTFKIKNDYIIGCAILFSQLDEWKKIRRDPKDPQPTNTSNGESYDPPNRLNGCFTAGGDGE